MANIQSLRSILAEAQALARAEARRVEEARRAERARLRAEAARVKAAKAQAPAEEPVDEGQLLALVDADLLGREAERGRQALGRALTELEAATKAAGQSVQAWAAEAAQVLRELVKLTSSSGAVGRKAQEGLRAWAEAMVASGWEEVSRREAIKRLRSARGKAREALEAAERLTARIEAFRAQAGVPVSGEAGLRSAAEAARKALAVQGPEAPAAVLATLVAACGPQGAAVKAVFEAAEAAVRRARRAQKGHTIVTLAQVLPAAELRALEALKAQLRR